MGNMAGECVADEKRGRQMTSNPFDDPETTYLALINDEGQYSLWPSFAAIPAGWLVVHEEDRRDACIEYINRHWEDMRPKSLRRSS
jgi:MbtH protein